MKTLIVLTLISFNAIAGDISFGTANFSIIKVERDCAGRPGGPMCESLSGKVTVAATVGCLDKVIATHFEMADNTEVPTIRAVSVVRNDSDSARVRCFRANTVVKTVQVPDVNDVSIINEEIR